MTCAPSHLLPERHAGGRPRTVSLPPDEMILLGEEMILWVKLNNPFHLSEWYTIEKMFTYKQWDTMSKLPEFLPYYEKAIKMVARNYLNGNVNASIAQRFLRIYFKDVKDQEDEDAKTASNLKKEEARVISDVESSKLDTFIDMVSSLQASSKALKSEEIKSNAEAKS